MAQWYYIGLHGQIGPLDEDQVGELIECGVIETDTYVWRSGMPEWVPAGQVPELLAQIRQLQPLLETPPAPPPIPPRTSGQTFGTGSGSGSVSQPPSPPTGAYGQPTLTPTAPYAYGGHLSGVVKSDRSRVAGGILNVMVPGIGRMYLGYSAIGVLQLVGTVLTCGLLWVWPFVDGLLILAGTPKVDGYGRILDPR
ncbi:MAG: GYF domain-containing protein [Fimbriimonadaceae bacterium]